MQHRHHQDVDAEEDEHWVVAARPERVGEEDKDKEPSDDLEEDGEEEYDAVEESGQVLVQGAALQRRVVRSKTPRQTEKHISWSTINQIPKKYCKNKSKIRTFSKDLLWKPENGGDNGDGLVRLNQRYPSRKVAHREDLNEGPLKLIYVYNGIREK